MGLPTERVYIQRHEHQGLAELQVADIFFCRADRESELRS